MRCLRWSPRPMAPLQEMCGEQGCARRDGGKRIHRGVSQEITTDRAECYGWIQGGRQAVTSWCGPSPSSPGTRAIPGYKPMTATRDCSLTKKQRHQPAPSLAQSPQVWAPSHGSITRPLPPAPAKAQVEGGKGGGSGSSNNPPGTAHEIGGGVN